MCANLIDAHHLLDAQHKLRTCRGIDFKGVRTVVNVHPPPDVPTYVHRVGRTGRAGQAGTAVSLLSPRDATLAGQIEAALSGELRDEHVHASPGSPGQPTAAFLQFSSMLSLLTRSVHG